MNRDSKELARKVDATFASVFSSTPPERFESLRRGDYPWDSLRHIELINAVERDFKLAISVEQALKIADRSSLIAVILNASGITAT